MDKLLYCVLVSCLISCLKDFAIIAFTYHQDRYVSPSIYNYRESQLLEKIQHFANDLRLEQEHDLSYRQEIIRLKSTCSHKYVSLRENYIRADVSIQDAFDDKFTLIEIVYSNQMNPKLVALKSFLKKTYICFDLNRGLFKLTKSQLIDENCIFTLQQTSTGRMKFTLGDSNISNLTLSFDRHGRMISLYSRRYRATSCGDETFEKIKRKSDNRVHLVVQHKNTRHKSKRRISNRNSSSLNVPKNYETLVYYYTKPKNF